MEQPAIYEDTPAWIVFVHISFATSLALMGIGIYMLPVDLWIKGYLAMGLFFTVGSTLSLAKTTRDNHERRKLVNRLKEVKTERLLHEYEMKA